MSRYLVDIRWSQASRFLEMESQSLISSAEALDTHTVVSDHSGLVL